jgi:integrase
MHSSNERRAYHALLDLDTLTPVALPDPEPGTMSTLAISRPSGINHRVSNVPVSSFDATEQHTIDHINCPACGAADVALRGVDLNLLQMSFPQASKYWLGLRRQSTQIKPRTIEATETYLNSLGKFFGSIRLCEITPGNLRAYQIARLSNRLLIESKETKPWKKATKNTTVNHELSVLQQILKHANIWGRLRPFYFPLKVPTWSPRPEILSIEAEAKLFKDAARDPRAALAYWIATITNNTSAAGMELRGLRLKNVFLREAPEISEIYVPEDAVKNNSRPRKIPLNETAMWAVGECYKRALKLGSTDPDHYLFPFCKARRKYDPTKQASRGFLRKSWEKLRKISGCPHLSPHDLRHHCVTKMLEAGINESTVKSICGHVTQKMLDYYAHQRAQVKHEALKKIDCHTSPPKPAKEEVILFNCLAHGYYDESPADRYLRRLFEHETDMAHTSGEPNWQ